MDIRGSRQFRESITDGRGYQHSTDGNAHPGNSASFAPAPSRCSRRVCRSRRAFDAAGRAPTWSTAGSGWSAQSQPTGTRGSPSVPSADYAARPGARDGPSTAAATAAAEGEANAVSTTAVNFCELRFKWRGLCCGDLVLASTKSEGESGCGKFTIVIPQGVVYPICFSLVRKKQIEGCSGFRSQRSEKAPPLQKHN